MKLKCKIKDKYLRQILSGKKKVEYRQVESIIFVDEQGNEYEFEVGDIWQANTYEADKIKRLHPDMFELGRRIK